MFLAFRVRLKRYFWLVAEDVRVDPYSDFFFSDEYHLIGNKKVAKDLD